MLSVLVDVIVPVLLVAAVGGLVGRRVGLSVDTLSTAAFWLFSPALVFVSIAGVRVPAGDVGRMAVVAVLVFVANVVLALVWSRLRGLEPGARAAAVVSSAVPNQGNLGLPMAQLAFGQRGLQIGVLIWVIGVVLATSLGITAGTIAKGGHSHLSALAAPFRFPSIYAAIAGLAVNLGDVTLPVAIQESLDTLAVAAIPCMLLVLGLSFHLPRPDHLVEPLAISVNRLVIGPLLAWPLAIAVGLDGISESTSIMMAGMPTAVMTTIIVLQLGLRTELAVRSVVVSTLASVASLTVLLTLLR